MTAKFRMFKSEKGANAAIKRAGLHGLPVRFEKMDRGFVLPILTVADKDDKVYVEEFKHFRAVIGIVPGVEPEAAEGAEAE